jgi:hypothetical protein
VNAFILGLCLLQLNARQELLTQYLDRVHKASLVTRSIKNQVMTSFSYMSLGIASKTVSCFLDGVGRGRMTRQNVSHLTQGGSHWRHSAYRLLSDIIPELI